MCILIINDNNIFLYINSILLHISFFFRIFAGKMRLRNIISLWKIRKKVESKCKKRSVKSGCKIFFSRETKITKWFYLCKCFFLLFVCSFLTPSFWRNIQLFIFFYVVKKLYRCIFLFNTFSLRLSQIEVYIANLKMDIIFFSHTGTYVL